MDYDVLQSAVTQEQLVTIRTALTLTSLGAAGWALSQSLHSDTEAKIYSWDWLLPESPEWQIHGPRAPCAKRGKSDRERQVPYALSHMWTLKKLNL